MSKVTDAMVNKEATRMMDEGKLLETGFALLIKFFGKELSPNKVAWLRFAYFAGAQHIFGTLMNMDGSNSDERRLELLNKELETWVKQMEADHAALTDAPTTTN